jgi:hypothetical protein
MIGRSVPWMAASLAGFLVLAASAQSGQDQRPAERPRLSVGAEHGEMTWEWAHGAGARMPGWTVQGPLVRGAVRDRRRHLRRREA